MSGQRDKRKGKAKIGETDPVCEYQRLKAGINISMENECFYLIQTGNKFTVLAFRKLPVMIY